SCGGSAGTPRSRSPSSRSWPVSCSPGPRRLRSRPVPERGVGGHAGVSTEVGRRRHAAAFSVGLPALGLYAFGTLSIGLTRGWRLIHADNGALHATLVYSHVRFVIRCIELVDLFFHATSALG